MTKFFILGIPIDKPCVTINKAMTSCIKSLVYACQNISMGFSDVVVAGGFGSMSNAPFLAHQQRRGHLFGQTQLYDSLVYDGLTDIYSNLSMGICADKLAEDYGISRKEQDEYCISSYERLIEATSKGKFKEEIVPIKLNDKEILNIDEEQNKFNKEKIPLLKPAFNKKNGTITAGNASKLADGAVSLSEVKSLF